MYLVGVTLRSLKYLRDAPDTPTLNLLLLMFTLDILYIHCSLSFAIRTAKAPAKVKNRCLHTSQIQGFPTAT